MDEAAPSFNASPLDLPPKTSSPPTFRRADNVPLRLEGLVSILMVIRQSTPEVTY